MMNTQVRSIPKVWLAPAALLLSITTGCPCEGDHLQMGSGYCDDSGCYQCDFEKHCWPVANAKCAKDADCGAGLACTTIGCAKACTSDAQCTAGESCVSGGFCAPGGFTSVTPYVPPTSCKVDEDCKLADYCKSGSCVPRCKSDDDCGPDMVCTECGKCEPKGIPATCGSTQVFCSDSVPCGAGKSCVKGRCHAQCTSSATCPIGQVCSAGLCIEDPGPAKPECKLNFECASGACINGHCHDACKTSAECGQGAVCQMGICQPDFAPAK